MELVLVLDGQGTVQISGDDSKTKTKLNSVTFSLQANYNDRATAACRPS
jgi:hypothetical protein